LPSQLEEAEIDFVARRRQLCNRGDESASRGLSFVIGWGRSPPFVVRKKPEEEVGGFAAACFFCGHLDTLDLRPKNEGRRDDK
jgi:hypothetical protein